MLAWVAQVLWPCVEMAPYVIVPIPMLNRWTLHCGLIEQVEIGV